MRQLFALRAQRGPYRYLIRKWANISDVDLAAKVMSTEFFRRELTPVSLPISNANTILVLAPHPDDEVIGAGGALLLASKAGVRIDVLYLMDGAAPNHPLRVCPLITS